MSASIDPEAMRAARRVARVAMRDGARAVVLTGSHATGGAHQFSDIDLVVIAPQRGGCAFAPPVQRSGRFLITVAVTTVAGVRRAFRDPALAGAYVPGWREAIVLADAEGAAARLAGAARRWSWHAVDAACDRWVAEEVAGYAEEVHKLAGALERGDDVLAAIERSVLALQLAKIASVYHRILYGSENVMWRMVSEAMGAEWASAQRAALGIDGESVRRSSEAGLMMYVMMAGVAEGLLDRQQRAVVAGAVRLAHNACEGDGLPSA